MPKSTLVDSNVLIDVWGAGEPVNNWSLDALATCRVEGFLVINPIVWSELAPSAPEEAWLEELAAEFGLGREAMPWSAAFLAGKAQLLYRRSGGARERALPDFLVGAHAVVAGHRILTRDSARYRTYFPTVEIIAPDTYP